MPPNGCMIVSENLCKNLHSTNDKTSKNIKLLVTWMLTSYTTNIDFRLDLDKFRLSSTLLEKYVPI